LFFVILHVGYKQESVHGFVHNLPSALTGSQQQESSCQPGSLHPSKIPNIAHFVHLFPDDNETHQFRFSFRHFLAMYAVWLHWRPDAIYLHTDASPAAIEAARNGKRGKWNRHIFNMPTLIVHSVKSPSKAGNGKIIEKIEHKSDFVRVEQVREMGGTYLDWDVMVLRDTRPLRESGFNAIVGHQPGGQVNSGIIMAKPHARFATSWLAEAHHVFDGGWVTHSNDVADRLARRMTRLPGAEVLIADQTAFSPGVTWQDVVVELLAVHEDVKSNLEGWREGVDKLPEHEEAYDDRWKHPERFPEWDTDFSSSYMVHCFEIEKVIGTPVTPRLVLERKTSFGRMMYAVVKHMYEAGLVSLDDSHESIPSD